MISVNYRSSLPLYEQIKENIIKLIMTKALKEDEALPSVRELAATLAINPNTIQRAYRELEGEGYIYKIAGKGTFVASRMETKADVEALLTSFREDTAKLIYNGADIDLLKNEIDKIYGEVAHND